MGNSWGKKFAGLASQLKLGPKMQEEMYYLLFLNPYLGPKS